MVDTGLSEGVDKSQTQGRTCGHGIVKMKI